MQVIWTLPASTDLEEIEDYVARDRPAAAYVLVNHIIDRTEALLTDAPKAGRAGRVAGTRELFLPKTSYIVVYRLTKSIEILAVVHGARDWSDELP